MSGDSASDSTCYRPEAGGSTVRAAAARPRVDKAMVKALARAFRWRKEMDTGVYGSLEELVRAEGIAPPTSRRTGRTLWKRSLHRRQPVELQIDDLLAGLSLENPGREQRGGDAPRLLPVG